MYGTVARMRLKPGMEAKLKDDMAQYDQLKIPGFVSTVVYRMDRDPMRVRSPRIQSGTTARSSNPKWRSDTPN